MQAILRRDLEDLFELKQWFPLPLKTFCDEQGTKKLLKATILRGSEQVYRLLTGASAEFDDSLFIQLIGNQKLSSLEAAMLYVAITIGREYDEHESGGQHSKLTKDVIRLCSLLQCTSALNLEWARLGQVAVDAGLFSKQFQTALLQYFEVTGVPI
jgi:hypothetical protein